MRPLPGHIHRDAAFLVDECHACFRLQVSVLLGRRVVFAFHNDVGLGEGGFHIALADAVVGENVGAEFGVHQRGIGLHGFPRVGHDWQVFVFHADEVAGAGRNFLGFGHHHRDLVAHKAHPVGVGLVGAGPAEHRLVGFHQAVFVVGHIFGGEHAQHAGQRLRGRGINAHDARVGPSGEQNFHISHVGQVNVGREERPAGHFVGGINAAQGLTEGVHGKPPKE